MTDAKIKKIIGNVTKLNFFLSYIGLNRVNEDCNLFP